MNVIEAAKAAGAEFYAETLCVNGKDCHDFIERFAQIIRNQALEDAAECCDDEAEGFRQWKQGASDGRYDWKEDAAEDCADAIRAMKKEQPNG